MSEGTLLFGDVMLETHGDIWSIDADWKVIPTNGIVNHEGKAVMGRGLALDAKNRYPGIEMVLGMHLLTHGNLPGLLGFYDNVWLFSFPTKDHYQNLSTTKLIINSAKELKKMWNRAVDKSGSELKVVLPKVGCGLGGLDWNYDVKPLMEKIFPEWNFVFLSKEEK